MANRKKSPSKRPKKKEPRAAAPKKAATDKHAPDVKIERFRQNMRCELTNEELNEKARQVARKLSEKALRVEAAKSATAHLKAEIKQIDAELSRLSQEINDGATYREVDCERHFKYRVGNVVEIRMDTNEQTFERPMNASERQPELPGLGSKKSQPKETENKESDDADEGEEAPASDDEPSVGDEVEAPEENGDVPA